jgi:hypothetical protein
MTPTYIAASRGLPPQPARVAVQANNRLVVDRSQFTFMAELAKAAILVKFGEIIVRFGLLEVIDIHADCFSRRGNSAKQSNQYRGEHALEKRHLSPRS